MRAATLAGLDDGQHIGQQFEGGFRLDDRRRVYHECLHPVGDTRFRVRTTSQPGKTENLSGGVGAAALAPPPPPPPSITFSLLSVSCCLYIAQLYNYKHHASCTARSCTCEYYAALQLVAYMALAMHGQPQPAATIAFSTPYRV